MAYSKIWEFAANGNISDFTNGPAAAWRYVFLDFMPTRGWEVSMTGTTDAVPPTSTVDTMFWFKKTNTCIDGSTYDVAFAIECEWGSNDIMYYSWDGVKATGDSSDPEYGRGVGSKFNDTTFIPFYPSRTTEIWADSESDGFFLVNGGRWCGGWFPDGGWIRQDFTYPEGTDIVFDQPVPMLLWETYSTMAIAQDAGRYISNSHSYDEPNKRKLTDFVQIDANPYAMWRDLDGRFLTRASYVNVNPEEYISSIVIDPDGANPQYYIDLGSNAGWNSILFPAGSTDPGI